MIPRDSLIRDPKWLILPVALEQHDHWEGATATLCRWHVDKHFPVHTRLGDRERAWNKHTRSTAKARALLREGQPDR